MHPGTEAALKIALCLIAVAVVVYRHRFARGLKPAQAGQLLALMAVVAGLAYTNFGEFNGWPPIHSREMYHYFLGSKYFPELGYDGLYVASLEAQRQSRPDLETQEFIRDLRSNEVVLTDGLRSHAAEVRGRFTEDRWLSFVSDHDYFLSTTYPILTFYRYDHGYNPPPNWTFVGRSISRWLSGTEATLHRLTFLDLFLAVVAFAAIYRTFGARVACLSALVFGLGAPWRYDWTGGAFLRNDWLALLVLGICALKRERFAVAGLLIGYAASLRVFPAAFLIGPALVMVHDLVRRKPVRWFLSLGGGVAVSLLLAFALGSLAGSGISAWPDFVDNIRLHHQTISANSVGVKSVVLMDAAVAARHATKNDLLESIAGWDRRLERAASNRRPLILGASLVFSLMVLSSSWNRAVVEASVVGGALIFGLMAPSCYYFVFLVLVPVVGDGWRTTSALLMISAAVFVMRLETRLYEVIYGVTSWALLVFFVAWLAPGAWRGVTSFASKPAAAARE
jgi:hypothetical protein